MHWKAAKALMFYGIFQWGIYSFVLSRFWIDFTSKYNFLVIIKSTVEYSFNVGNAAESDLSVEDWLKKIMSQQWSVAVRGSCYLEVMNVAVCTSLKLLFSFYLATV